MNQSNTKLEQLQFWVQQTLPAVYDDSLSFYELLSKVVKQLNDTITQTNTLTDMVNEMMKYIEENVQENVVDIMNLWLADGRLTAIIGETLGQANVKGYGAKGDGSTDDTVAIQNALNSGIGTIFIPDGTYMISSTLVIKMNTKLVLSNKAVLKRNANVDCLLRNESNGNGGYLANQNISIIGGTIDGNKAMYQTPCTLLGFGHMTNLTITGVTFQNLYDWHMVEINAVKTAKITECSFLEYGTLTTGTEALQIDLMYDSTRFPWFGPYDSTPCTDITIDKCRFINGVKGIGSHTGAEGIKHTDVRITNCFFENQRAEAIITLGYDNLIITGNEFNNCLKGIYLQAWSLSSACRNIEISKNIIRNCNATGGRAIQVGSYMNHGVIEGNIIENCNNHGIGVDLGDRWTIANNNVTGCQNVGIWVYGTNRSNVVGNNCHGNVLSGVTNRYDITIGFYGGTDTSTVDVNVTGNSCESLGVSSASRINVTGNQIYTKYEEYAPVKNIRKSLNQIVQDFYSTDVILKSPDNTLYRITVANGGALSTVVANN